MTDPVVSQRLSIMEENQRAIHSAVKELEQRVNGHDRTIDRMELITENMKNDWARVDSRFQGMIDAQNKLLIETQKSFEIQAQMVIDAQRNAEAQTASSSDTVDKILTVGVDVLKIFAGMVIAFLVGKATGKIP